MRSDVYCTTMSIIVPRKYNGVDSSRRSMSVSGSIAYSFLKAQSAARGDEFTSVGECVIRRIKGAEPESRATFRLGGNRVAGGTSCPVFEEIA